MADKDESEKLSPLDALDRKFLKEAGDRRAAIDAAMETMRAAQRKLEEAKAKVAQLQQANINASFAHDAARAELVAKSK